MYKYLLTISSCFTRSQPVDILLLRGAIFFTGMAIWGSRRVTSLKYTYNSVLPSFLQVRKVFVQEAIISFY